MVILLISVSRDSNSRYWWAKSNDQTTGFQTAETWKQNLSFAGSDMMIENRKEIFAFGNITNNVLT